MRKQAMYNQLLKTLGKSATFQLASFSLNFNPLGVDSKQTKGSYNSIMTSQCDYMNVDCVANRWWDINM